MWPTVNVLCVCVGCCLSYAAALETSDEKVEYGLLVKISAPIIALVGTVGNLLILFCLICDSQLHCAHNIFIMNIVICDLIFGAVVVPMHSIQYHLKFEHILCAAILTLECSLQFEITLLLLLVIRDRAALMKKDLLYAHDVSLLNAKKQIAVTWVATLLFSILYGYFVHYSDENIYAKYNLCLYDFVPYIDFGSIIEMIFYVLLLVTSSYVFLLARKQHASVSEYAQEESADMPEKKQSLVRMMGREASSDSYRTSASRPKEIEKKAVLPADCHSPVSYKEEKCTAPSNLAPHLQPSCSPAPSSSLAKAEPKMVEYRGRLNSTATPLCQKTDHILTQIVSVRRPTFRQQRYLVVTTAVSLLFGAHFLLCLPLTIMRFLTSGNILLRSKSSTTTVYFLQWLALSRTAVYPFIYCFYSKRLRVDILQIFLRCFNSKKSRKGALRNRFT